MGETITDIMAGKKKRKKKEEEKTQTLQIKYLSGIALQFLISAASLLEARSQRQTDYFFK